MKKKTNYSISREQVQKLAQEHFNTIMTLNPNFNNEITSNRWDITTNGKKMNGFILYMKILQENFWIHNSHIKIQRVRIATNTLLWKSLTKEQKDHFGNAAKQISKNVIIQI